MEISLTYLFGGAAAILAALFYLWTKKNSAEALNENINVKNEINELDKQVSKNDGLLESEEEKRKKLQDELNDEKKQNLNLLDLLHFFTKR